MESKIYVGNIPYTMSDSSLEEFFSSIGKVNSAKVITYRDSGRSKGYAFVEMSSKDEADKAIDQFNNSQVGGRTIKVNSAKPKK